MSAEHLAQMANDIAHFFASETRHEDAIAGIANHIDKFWDPRMRRQIEKHLAEGGEGLEPLAREAVARLTAAVTT
ncbi:MAG TPA: formate dehydrogenase subunit delta [Steroidobacteraceae bacterium]|jgi:formate dehydrogenase subunit delta|nr:formate dehydrogenase subunit delta [Steroidobacteraceae bacterium]